MKHLILFENWKDKLIFTKKGAQEWISKNKDKIREINKKENSLGQFLTIEEQNFMDTYISMYNKVHSEEDEELYNGRTYKEMRKSFNPLKK